MLKILFKTIYNICFKYKCDTMDVTQLILISLQVAGVIDLPWYILFLPIIITLVIAAVYFIYNILIIILKFNDDTQD
jgi:hypothetical protein